MILFLADSTIHLQRSFARHGFRVGRYESYCFADGERGYRLKEDVHRESAAVVASILPDPRSLFDLMALNRLVFENGAKGGILVIPYLGYARQDRLTRRGEGSLGIMVAEFLRRLPVQKLISFDVHSDLVRKALGRSTLELSALPLFARALSKDPPDVIVSPDAGSVSRGKELAKLLESRPQVAAIDKVRPRRNVAVARRLHGEVKGKRILIVDDIIDTGGTLSEAVNLVSREGARSIRLAATHGIFSQNARDRLLGLPIEEILITNTLPQIRSPKIRVLDIVPLIGEILSRT